MKKFTYHIARITYLDFLIFTYRMLCVMILVFCILLLSACNPKIITAVASEKIVFKDSIVEILRDTTVYIEIERLVSTNTIPDTDTSVLENKFAVSSAFIFNNLLFHNLEQKQQDIAFNVKYVDRWHTQSIDREVEKPVIIEVEKKLSQWQNMYFKLGKVFFFTLIACLSFAVFKIYRKIRP